MAEKGKEKVISWDDILTRAEEITGIKKNDIGAAYDGVISARNAIYEDNREFLENNIGNNIKFMQPDLALVVRRCAAHIEKDAYGNDISVPESNNIFVGVAQSMVLGFNAGMTLDSVTPVAAEDKKQKAS